jgi:hypothetical protein
MHNDGGMRKTPFFRSGIRVRNLSDICSLQIADQKIKDQSTFEF